MYFLLPLYCPGKISQHLSEWATSIAVVFAVQDRRPCLSRDRNPLRRPPTRGIIPMLIELCAAAFSFECRLFQRFDVYGIYIWSVVPSVIVETS